MHFLIASALDMYVDQCFALTFACNTTHDFVKTDPKFRRLCQQNTEAHGSCCFLGTDLSAEFYRCAYKRLNVF